MAERTPSKLPAPSLQMRSKHCRQAGRAIASVRVVSGWNVLFDPRLRQLSDANLSVIDVAFKGFIGGGVSEPITRIPSAFAK